MVCVCLIVCLCVVGCTTANTMSTVRPPGWQTDEFVEALKMQLNMDIDEKQKVRQSGPYCDGVESHSVANALGDAMVVRSTAKC